MKLKIKKGDEVMVMVGKDRNKRGKIIRTIPGQNRVVIEGVNLRKKHVRPRRAGEKGQTVLVPSPLAASNVMILCRTCSKPTRLGWRVEGGTKIRICKKCGNSVV